MCAEFTVEKLSEEFLTNSIAVPVLVYVDSECIHAGVNTLISEAANVSKVSTILIR